MKYKIHLSERQRLIVGMTKNHYPALIADTKDWHEALLKMFSVIYGYSFQKTSFADNFHIFQKLYEIFVKISENQQQQLLEVLKKAFNPNLMDDVLSVQVAINEICRFIQSTVVEGRFEVDLPKEQTDKFIADYEKLFHS